MRKKKDAENEQYRQKIKNDERAALDNMFKRKQDMKNYIDGLLG